jgi:tetratricopeptide (TPR) repeat protein
MDWMASAAPSILAGDLGSQAVRAAGASNAYLSGATRFLHGYFTGKAPQVRFAIEVEDAARHKMTEFAVQTGPVLTAMNAAAKSIDPAAKDFSTSKEDAVEAWGRGDFEKAVAIDPGFGAAWLAWTESLTQQHNAAQATEVADRALQQTGLRSDVDRARIELMSATLHQNRGAQVSALRNLAALDHDKATKGALAEAELNARDFAGAAAVFESLLAEDPTNWQALLNLGYAQAYQGLVDAAKATFEKYGKEPGQKANALDSTGEAYFMNGKFGDAEKYFLSASQADARFLNGADTLKAAYARWLSGDLKGADGIAAQFFATQKNDPWQEASWLFATGRRDEAIAKLQSADKRVADRQTGAWSGPLPSSVEELKAVYERTPPGEDGLVRTLYAWALVKAGRKDEARALVSRWPLPLLQAGDAMMQSRMFPTFLEVRHALQ